MESFSCFIIICISSDNEEFLLVIIKASAMWREWERGRKRGEWIGRGTGAGLWNINNIFVPLFEWLHLSSTEIKQCCLKCADMEKAIIAHLRAFSSKRVAEDPGMRCKGKVIHKKGKLSLSSCVLPISLHFLVTCCYMLYLCVSYTNTGRHI